VSFLKNWNGSRGRHVGGRRIQSQAPCHTNLNHQTLKALYLWELAQIMVV